MSDDRDNETEWRDPRNWRGGWLGIYHAPRDSRLIVPRRRRFLGWTINVGRPAGQIFMYVILMLGAIAILASWTG